MINVLPSFLTRSSWRRSYSREKCDKPMSIFFFFGSEEILATFFLDSFFLALIIRADCLLGILMDFRLLDIFAIRFISEPARPFRGILNDVLSVVFLFGFGFCCSALRHCSFSLLSLLFSFFLGLFQGSFRMDFLVFLLGFTARDHNLIFRIKIIKESLNSPTTLIIRPHFPGQYIYSLFLLIHLMSLATVLYQNAPSTGLNLIKSAPFDQKQGGSELFELALRTSL